MADLYGTLHAYPVLFAVLVVFWGLSLGSFTTCVLYRVPRGLSLWRDKDGSHRSFCPACHAHLTMLDLVPVLSWLFLRGRCRHCGGAIPVRYLSVELAVFVIVCIIGVITGFSVGFFLLSGSLPAVTGLWAWLNKKYVF